MVEQEAGSGRQERRPTPAPRSQTISDDQFQEIRIKKTGAEPIDLKRDNGKWQILEPKPMPADPDTASSLVTALSSLSADKTIEDNATDLSAYGLANPQLDVTVIRERRQDRRVAAGRRYAHQFGHLRQARQRPARLYRVGSFVKTSVDKSLNDLRDKRLLTFDHDKLTRVELQAKGAAGGVRQEPARTSGRS